MTPVRCRVQLSGRTATRCGYTITMTWKDKWRDEKDASGLTWDEFHERQFVHVSELDGATKTLEALDEHVRACANEYREMKQELHEVRVLLESEQFDP